MTTPQHRPPLAALAAAVFALSLAACGGGGGEAPPDRPGSVVAPAAPVVTITNNVAAETATGPITFTFSFNRDVGTSFTADDVTVTSGSKGAFTRLSGTGATLVVVPTANSSGTILLKVSEGSTPENVQVSVCQPTTTGSLADTSPELAPPGPSIFITIGMPASGE